MPIRTFTFIIALAIFLSSLYLLISGSSLLALPIGKESGFPFGTLITWAGIIALPTVIYTGLGALHRPGNKVAVWYRKAIKALILLAASWGFVCYYLAGNWAFSFSGSAPSFRGSTEAAPYFWYFSGLVVLLPLVFLLVYGIHRLVWKRAKKKKVH